ncbi:MAG: hypothetical protein JHC93_05205 [Parachlamydiales bacterium]|nr:hypothetical protein [Parachlamydiales bacterium]
MRLPLFILSSICATHLIAQEVTITTCNGENFILDISPQERFWDVTEKIDGFFTESKIAEGLLFEIGAEEPPFQEFYAANGENNFRFYTAAIDQPVEHYPRNYYVTANAEQKKDIAYIVNTLADKTLPKILMSKSSLEAAGERISVIHPLQFLITIFTDEQLKVGIRNIKNKPIVWKDFFGGFRDSIDEESKIGNILPEHIENFAKTLNLDPALIAPSIENRRWEELMDKLITLIPRNGNKDRYDF